MPDQYILFRDYECMVELESKPARDRWTRLTGPTPAVQMSHKVEAGDDDLDLLKCEISKVKFMQEQLVSQCPPMRHHT